MILIGSKAIKHWFPDFPREPKDTDYAIGGTIKIQGDSGVEFLNNSVLDEYYQPHNGTVVTADPDVLYTLKMSHLFWDVNWEKHAFDMVFLQKKGCKLNRPLFFKLYEYFNELHGANKRSDLKMSAADFFDNALDCPYDHDKLHTYLQNPPTYTKILIGEVEVSEEKFNELSFEDKCNLVYEEIELMSWERWGKWDYRKAYGKMFKKFIISHAPLWEAIFILENFVKLSRFRRNHFQIIENGIKNEQRNNIIKRSTRSFEKQVAL